MPNEENLEQIKSGIEAFLEENNSAVFSVKEDFITSQELGKECNISAIKTNQILEKNNYLKKDDNGKWKLTSKGERIGFTPVKFVIKLEDNCLIIYLKKENPKWFTSFKEMFSKIVKEYKEEIEDETK